MAEKRDYYEVLGVARDADDDTIKKAYRRLAKKYHPDVNQGNAQAEAMFKEVNEAYEVLSDSDKRARYDQFGHAGLDPNAQASGFGGGFDFSNMGMGGLGDIFESFFGGGASSRRNGPMRGGDVQKGINISFEEAAFGCKKEIEISRVEVCSECEGTGAKPGTPINTCSVCGGTGQVRVQQRTPFGTFASTRPCESCGGRGKVIKDPCFTCRGKGKVKRTKKIEVSIPAGIDSGQTISIRGQGDSGYRGGPPGDLLVTIGIRPHPIFERQGPDVILDLPITIVQASLGAELEVPTLDGHVKYNMPAGTQNGTVFRLKGKGIPYLQSKGRGDEFVKVNVEIPKNLTDRQKELLREFEKTGGGSYEKNKNFSEKIKDLLNKNAKQSKKSKEKGKE